jgi:hypothetical protein
MAMTLRTTEDDDRLIDELARAEGVSKHEAVLRAVRETAERVRHHEAVDDAARRTMDRYGDLLRRLGE